MRELRSLCTALFVSVLAVSTLSAGPTEFTGKWELAIGNLGSSFRSCALKVELRDGKIAGELVWRWGSVQDIAGRARLSEKGTLLIEKGDFATPLELRRVGNFLEGSTTIKDGNETKSVSVLGWPSREEPAAIGSWDLIAKTNEGEKSGKLRLWRHPGADAEVEVIGAEGQAVTTKELAVADDRVRFRFLLGDAEPEFLATAKGMRLSGKVLTPNGDEIRIEGTRQLKHGATVKLIPQNGLAGWKPREQGRNYGWTCENGVLTNGEHDVDIVSEREFQDFQLHVEFKVAKGSNSGVYLRGRYEVQIQDDFGKPLESHGIGAIYSRAAPTKNAAKPADEWQTFDIALVGRWLTVKLNSETIIDDVHIDGITGGAESPTESAPGPLMLQGDHGKISFRNIVVVPLVSP